MGFAASQARQLMMTGYISDLEFQGQMINQARLQLANSIGQLYTTSTDLSPESAQTRQITAAIAAIQQLDKQLELQLRRVDNQRRAATSELDAVKKYLDEGIQRSFKTFG